MGICPYIGVCALKKVANRRGTAELLATDRSGAGFPKERRIAIGQEVLGLLGRDSVAELHSSQFLLTVNVTN